MKNKKSLVIALIIIFILGIVAYYKLRAQHNSETEQARVWVKAVPVQEKFVSSDIHALGTLSAPNVIITPEVAGHIKKILFVDGQEVKKGQALIELDNSIYLNKQKLAEAKLAYAKADFSRLSTLSQKGIITKQALDAAAASFKERETDANEARLALDKTILRAPFTGVVGQSQVTIGAFVNMGEKIVTLTDTQNIRVEYTLPEKNLGQIQLGQAIKLTTLAYPGKEFFGKVAYIAPSLNIENRSVSVYAKMDNPKNLLVSGMLASVKHKIAAQKNVLLIPARSLMPILGGSQVYKIVDNKAYVVKVKVGPRYQNEVQIFEGLSTKDIVVTDGQLKLQNGLPVNISPSGKA